MSGNPQAGGTITVTGSGFTAGQNVLVEVHSDPYALGTATVGADGRFTISGTLPADFPAGEHSVVAIVDGQTIAAAVVTIAAATPATAVETAPVATRTAQSVSGASISWGVKESFVSNVNGPIAKGSADISWGSGSGSFNADENLGRVNYGGAATFTGHSGVLSLTLSNPSIQVNGAGSATLSVSRTARGSRSRRCRCRRHRSRAERSRGGTPRRPSRAPARACSATTATRSTRPARRSTRCRSRGRSAARCRAT